MGMVPASMLVTSFFAGIAGYQAFSKAMENLFCFFIRMMRYVPVSRPSVVARRVVEMASQGIDEFIAGKLVEHGVPVGVDGWRKMKLQKPAFGGEKVLHSVLWPRALPGRQCRRLGSFTVRSLVMASTPM